MSDDDLISGLQAAVKQEILERYLLERRIVEEEVNLLLEDACAFHGGVAAWRRDKARLAAVLMEPAAVEEFFAAAGLGLPTQDPGPGRHRRPRALTATGRYRALVGRLYRGLCDQHAELKEERQRMHKLLAEVNQDIRHFEADHDLMTITAYLRSLDPQEIRRRKILGTNFTAAETAEAVARLSFKPVAAAHLELDDLPDDPREPGGVLAAMKGLLGRVAKAHRREIAGLWIETLEDLDQAMKGSQTPETCTSRLD